MLRDIIREQKLEYERKKKERYVQRQFVSINPGSGLIQVIIGPRRAGKSFFGIHQLTDDISFGYVNFDDERLMAITDFDELLRAVIAVYGNPEMLLFDEIQNLPNWEIIVNRLQRQGFQLVITGSNSRLLSRELATHLTGRHQPVYLFTFSFKEYLATFDNLVTPDITEHFNDYLSHGGYPEPLIKKLDHKAYLKVLFDSVLFKDIVKRHRIRYAASLENLASWLISNISGELSLNSLAKQTQISSVHTVKKYLGYLEEAFIFFRLKRFSWKPGSQIKHNQKIYCYDNGFFLAKAFRFSDDHGKLLENLIAVELTKRSFYDQSRIFFWKNNEQEEVDFVIQRGTKVSQLIQVCWSSADQRTKQREIRALLKASRDLKCNDLLIITYNEQSRQKASWYGMEGEIEFIPAVEWLTG
jgi:uncharacterized protein